MKTELEFSNKPNFSAASSPYSCATSAEQGKEKWTKLKSVTSRISSALTPMPWQRQEEKDLQTQIQNNWILTTTIFFFVNILKCYSVVWNITQKKKKKNAIKSTLVHLLWKVFTHLLHMFYFYPKVQEDKIHSCASKMLWTHKAQGRC